MKRNVQILSTHIFIAMRYSSLILAWIILSLSIIHARPVDAQGLKETTVALQLKNQPLKRVLQEIERQSAYRFVYSNGSIPETQKISIHMESSLPEVLDHIAQVTHTRYEPVGKNIVVTYVPPQQPVQVSGRITDTDGASLGGASIRVIETGRSFSADNDGYYSLSLLPGEYTFEISYVSYATQQRRGISVEAGRPLTLDFALEAQLGELSEVVVVGYGQNIRKNLTTSVGSLTPADVPQRNVASANQLLQGQIAGVNLPMPSGTPGGRSRVSIRGISSINGDNEPLYVIDGIPLSKETASYNFSGEYRQDPLSLINPNDIESIDVLKD